MTKIESYRQGTPCYVELMAPDPAAAAAFYADVLGWSIEETEVPEFGVYRSGKVGGDFVSGISGQMPELAGHPAFWGVYLAVDDVDATVAKVEAAGGKVDAGPIDVMDMGRMASIQDPTGARVNLWQAGTSIGTERVNEPGAPTWNEVVTPEVDRAVQFYADVLGMGSEQQAMGEQTYTSLTDVDGKVVGGTMAPQFEGVPPHWNLYFHVADVDATVAKVEAGGGKVVVPVFEVPIGRIGFVSDPQGAMFGVMQPAGQ